MLVKLNNFIDTYLYIVKFMDPKLINYITQTDEAVSSVSYTHLRAHETREDRVLRGVG